jgi:hypothetical protein
MARELDHPEYAAHSQLLLAHRTVRRHVAAVRSVEMMSGAAYRTTAALAEFIHSNHRLEVMAAA